MVCICFNWSLSYDSRSWWFSVNIPAFENISIDLPNNKFLIIDKTGPDNFFIKSLSLIMTSLITQLG